MKKIAVLFTLFVMTISLFAQNAKFVGLKDSDVKNWAKNFESIQKEFEKIGVNADDTLSVSLKKKVQVESILQKYGISGPEPIQKYATINQCATILYSETQLDEDSKALMKEYGLDLFADLKADINSKDYDVVAANSKDVLKAVEKASE